MVCRYIKARVVGEVTQKKIECALVEENAAVS